MVSKSQSETLERVLGYEVATLCMNRPRSRSDISDLLPYNVYNNQLERIIDACYNEGILIVTPERGEDKFELDHSLFNPLALEIINTKAIARMKNPAPARGGSVPVDDIPEEFFVCITRDRARGEVPVHLDYDNMKSRFIRVEDYFVGKE